DGARPGTRVELHLLRLVGDGVDLVVQVPLVLEPVSRPTGAPPGSAPPGGATTGGVAPIGTLAPGGADDAARVVPGGARPPAGWSALLAVAEWENPGTAPREASARGGRPDADTDPTGGRALSVAQSNSSVLLPRAAGGSMLKVLRAIAIGPNPDVTIPRALAAQGWAGAPRPLAWLEVRWDAADDPTDEAAGADHRPGEPTAGGGAPASGTAPGQEAPRSAHLAILSEFVEGARDGFDLACSYAGQGASFADLAADLGRVLADLHAALRRAFGVGSPVDARWLVADLRRRADEAVASSRALGRRADEVTA